MENGFKEYKYSSPYLGALRVMVDLKYSLLTINKMKMISSWREEEIRTR